MWKRLWWSIGTLSLPLLAIVIWLPTLQQQSQPIPPYDVIINEWSQGNGGSQEWVELLVVNGPVDLRYWDLGDNSPGDLIFTQAKLWQAVPTGTRIVIYNQADPDTILPPDDFDPSDCLLILPDEASTYFSGNLPQFSNSDPTDNPHLREATAVTVHDFSIAPGPSHHPVGSQTVQYQYNTAASVTDPTHWHRQPATTATPGSGNNITNTAWIDSLCTPTHPPQLADLATAKTGPATTIVSDTLTYQLTLENRGTFTATHVILTDTLPPAATYLTDNAPYPTWQPTPHQLIWHIGTLPPNSHLQFQLTATLTITATGTLTNHLQATTVTTETTHINNSAQALTLIQHNTLPSVLIDAIAYYGYEGSDDEAIRLHNRGQHAINLTGWQLEDGTTTAVLPTNFWLPAHSTAWLANDGTAFQRQFGFSPAAEQLDSQATIPDLLGNWPGFANSGDEVILRDAESNIVDTVVYGTGDTSQLGWSGTAVQPYRDHNNQFATTGQILFRRHDLPDSDRSLDWHQSTHDPINGRKVQYPGWDTDTFQQTVHFTETAVLTVAVAPDNAFSAILNHINHAQQTIQIETHTFENLAIADALIQAQERGVTVTILLEGNPPGGLPAQEKYICQQLEAVGGACWFMINDPENNIYDRYRFIHAKFILIDQTIAIISSENLSPNSLPYDDKTDGTWGRRGVILITNAGGILNHLESLFHHDLDPENHQDLFRWQAQHDNYGLPPLHFTPITQTGGVSYTVRYPTPTAWHTNFSFEIIQSPENSLQTPHSLLGLLNQAGAGDTILIQQLAERPHWGQTAVADPNPRLEAAIAAARRHATVRILLDAYFNDSRQASSNTATCAYVNEIARQENLQLTCALANPTGLGIHNKMVLVGGNGRYVSHIGSINGTELSSKGNRELALQIQSEPLYHFLADMFIQDWPWQLHFPIMYHNYLGPAQHILISEVLYDPPGVDDAEFIELINPTQQAIDITGYRLGDAQHPTDFEDMRLFPEGAVLHPHQPIVIATSALAFAAEYGYSPHYEILNTDPAIPQLIDDIAWGDPATFLQLGNNGDEVILRHPNGNIIDMLTYGAITTTHLTSTPHSPNPTAQSDICPLITTPYSSLERFPYWRDTNNCTTDFREWPFPSPGYLPD